MLPETCYVVVLIAILISAPTLAKHKVLVHDFDEVQFETVCKCKKRVSPMSSQSFVAFGPSRILLSASLIFCEIERWRTS